MAGQKKIESQADRRTLLNIARSVVMKSLGLDVPRETDSEMIPGSFGGAFVTFWVKGSLRGCVGSFAQTENICQTIRAVTRSTLADSRFEKQPLLESDLKELRIEISLLSQPKRTDQPASLTTGVHGIWIKSGSHSGCFLPKVATDRGWSAEEFLSNCCTMKASLPADAWKKPTATVYLFETETFCEAK